jgi:hypothetical protein
VETTGTSQVNVERFENQCIADLYDPSMNLRWLSDAIEKGFPGQPVLIRAGQ